MPAPSPGGEGLVERRVWVASENVAFLRYVLEGHDGLCLMHSDGSGVVALFAPESQAAALHALVEDLVREGTVQAI